MTTPIHPKMDSMIVAVRSYFPSLMNLKQDAFIRNAQEPIMIGNATPMFMPSAPTSAMHGAYRPTPIIINAPRKKLMTTPTTNLIPLSPVAVPTAPNGPTPAFLHTSATARITRPTDRA